MISLYNRVFVGKAGTFCEMWRKQKASGDFEMRDFSVGERTLKIISPHVFLTKTHGTKAPPNNGPT